MVVLAFYCASGVAAARRVTTGIRHAAWASRACRWSVPPAASSAGSAGPGPRLQSQTGLHGPLAGGGYDVPWPPRATPGCRGLGLPCERPVWFSAEIRAECHSGWYANDARVLTDRASALRRDSGDAVDASDMYYCQIYSSTDSDSELCKPARRSQTGFRGSDRDCHGCDVIGRWPPKVHVPTGPS